MQSFKKNIIGYIALFALALVVLPILKYIIVFAPNGTSNNAEDWAHFGDFINAWISLASLVLLSTLTYVIHKYDTQRQKEQNEEENRKNRPILIFKQTTVQYRDVWVIKNAGNLVALNIIVSFKTNVDSNYSKPTKIYSLMAGDEFVLDWIENSTQICAVYYDINNNVITSHGENHDTNILIGRNYLGSFGKDYQSVDEARNIQSNGFLGVG